MRRVIGRALALLVLAPPACTYFPVPPDPIRYSTSAAEVSTCRRLGGVGLARTDGEGPFSFSELTTPALTHEGRYRPPPRSGYEIVGPNFAVRLNVMRDAALSRGATDLLLVRRIYRDWSYVEGIAYLCRR